MRRKSPADSLVSSLHEFHKVVSPVYHVHRAGKTERERGDKGWGARALLRLHINFAVGQILERFFAEFGARGNDVGENPPAAGPLPADFLKTGELCSVRKSHPLRGFRIRVLKLASPGTNQRIFVFACMNIYNCKCRCRRWESSVPRGAGNSRRDLPLMEISLPPKLQRYLSSTSFQ